MCDMYMPLRRALGPRVARDCRVGLGPRSGLCRVGGHSGWAAAHLDKRTRELRGTAKSRHHSTGQRKRVARTSDTQTLYH